MISHNILELEKHLEVYFKNNEKAFLSCSGGVDSMFLFHIMRNKNFNFSVIIINHNLQKDSADVSQKTSEIVQKYNIESHVLEWKHNEIHTAIEERARMARHNLLSNFCQNNNIHNVILAHHIDDKIETFLMNSMRGTGIRGLISMQEVTVINKIEFFRPMLYLMEKKEIIQYMKHHNYEWFEDETNKNTRFTRNYIRHTFDFTSQQKKGILKTIKNIEDEFLRIQTEAISYCEENITNANMVLTVKIQNSIFQKNIFLLVIEYCLQVIYPYRMMSCRQSEIEQLLQWFKNGDGKNTLSLCIFVHKKNYIKMLPEYKRLKYTEVEENQEIIWNDMLKFICNQKCTVYALGNLPFSVKKLYNIKEKFENIAHLPVFMVGNNILAIPHLKIFNSQTFKVSFL